MTRDDLARALDELLRDPRAEADETPPSTGASGSAPSAR